jgi:hypothetical protein
MNTQEASRGYQRTPRGGPPRGTARWGRPASTLGRLAPGHCPLAPSFASYFNHLQGCILTLREGRFDPKAIVPCSGLYKRGPKPPTKRAIHSINHQPESRRPTSNSHLLRALSDLGIAGLELEVEESSSLGL